MKYLYITIITLISMLFLTTSAIAEDNNQKYIKQEIIELEKQIELRQSSSDKLKMKGIKQLYRRLWRLKHLENSSIDYNTVLNDKKQPKIQSSGWVPIGPFEAAHCYDPINGSGIGRVNCIEFHPNNPAIMWAATPNGGIWKTNSQGYSWSPVNEGLPVLQTTDIEVDPNNPDILFISTGDMDGGMSYRPYTSSSLGLFKSTDAGESWQATNLSYTSSTFTRSHIKKIIIHPDNSQRIIAAGPRGVWTSDDGGDHWDFIVDTLMVVSLAQDYSNPDILYAGLGHIRNWPGFAGVAKSTDFGKNWEILNTEIPEENIVHRVKVAVSPVDPNRVYALAAMRSTNGLFAFYASTNAGQSWEVKFDIENDYNIMGWFEGLDGDNSGQAWYDMTIHCDMLDADRVYVGAVNLWGTDDGGETWNPVTFWMNTFGKSVHADFHYSEYNPVDDYYYFCTDGSISRTKELLMGDKDWITECIDKENECLYENCPVYKFPTAWQELANNMQITEFYRLGLSRGHGGYVAGGSQDNGGFYGNTSVWLSYIVNYDGMEAMISHTDPNIVFGSAQFGKLFRSMDGCKTYTNKCTDTILETETGNWITPFAMDPVHDNIIYGGFKNLWRSTDYGDNWEKFCAISDSGHASGNINIIKIAPSNSDYMMISKPLSWQDTIGINELWITRDAGQKWELMTEGLPNDSIVVLDYCFDGNDENTMWITFYTNLQEFKIMHTTNSGQDWTSISKGFPNMGINSLVHEDGCMYNTLYAAVNNGVYFTNDTLDSWIRLNENLPAVAVNELEIDHEGRVLYAATYGRGMWVMGLVGTNGVESDENYDLEIKVTPNPNNGKFAVEVNGLPDGARDSKLELIDMQGRIIYTRANNEDYSSEALLDINLDLSVGSYFVKVSNGSKMKVAKMIVYK